jgi:hypothetical protein
MRTNELIRALTVDRAAAQQPPGRMLMLAAATGFALSAIAFVAWLGPRADVAQAVTSVRFLFKPLLMLALAAISAVLLLQLVRPGAAVRLLALAAIPAVMAVAVAAELAVLSPSRWPEALIGDNWYLCLSLIPLLSLPPAAALLLALRHGAPTRPAIAGAVAGLAAGGLAAALYAVNCTDDSPLFVATWYGLAIAAVSIACAIAGSRLLRW